MSDDQDLDARRRTRVRDGRLLAWATGGPGRPWLRSEAIFHGLSAVLERELEAGRGFLWLPVIFGIGIVVYFALPAEPSLTALLLATVVLAMAAHRAQTKILRFRSLTVAALLLAGVSAAKLRTDLVAAPVLRHEMTVSVSGWVAAIEAASRGGVRVLLRVDRIVGLPEAETPRTVRVTIRSKADRIAVGDALTLKARLQPPSGPLIPGGYDFARAAYYEGIGGIGFAYGAAAHAEIGRAPLDIRLWKPVADLRRLIRQRIVTALLGDNGEIAAALVMGDQGGISERVQDAMRASGLGHVLSISGLHMALVAGSAFFVIRALLALSEGLALRRPIKKWAAGAALFVALFYLGISGAGIATIRSFVMLAIMLLAIMIDRRALTLRNVALAALAILLVAPESLLSASFQMSFAATLAIVAAYEAIASRADRRSRLADPGGHGAFAAVRRAAVGLFLTSLVASLATAPFAIYHFQRSAPLSLLANLAAMPVIGIVVMPMALLTVLVMPFGLEAIPLAAMSVGLDWMVAVAGKIAEWSAGWGGVRLAPPATILFVAGGLLWLTLWRERWRYAGFALVAAGAVVALVAPRPDVFVAENGAVAAVRGNDGRLSMIGGRGHAFEVETWLRADGDPRLPTDSSLSEGVACDPLGCTAQLAGGGLVALASSAAALIDDCRLAEIVIARSAAPAGCGAAVVIDRSFREVAGAVALYREDGQSPIRIEGAYPSARRPFMPPRGDAQ